MTRRKKKSGVRNILLLAVLAVALIGGFFGYKVYNALYSPNVELQGANEAFVFIKSSDGYAQLLSKLETSGYIKNFETFAFVAEQKKLEKSVKPGKYRLENGMSNNVLVNMLKAGNQIPVRIQLNREITLEEVASTLSKQLEADSVSLMTLLTNEDTAHFYGFEPETFVAMFIPNTYEFYWATPPRKVLGRFADEYRKVWTAERLQKAETIGFTKDEVATLASIVAQETAMKSESEKIAGVYINRLHAGIPLQADPTLRFAAKDPAIQRVLNAHKTINSPYNTYINKGLPPGPIGLAAVNFIDAVLNYEKHNYLYFCAKEDFSGYSNFTASYAEHQQNAKKYQRALSKRGIMK